MGFTYRNVVVAFCVTALWDVVLRLFAEKRIRLAGIGEWTWVRTLQPYFEKHTVLGAALIAGFVGAVAYVVISAPAFIESLSMPAYIAWVLVVSALLGVPMRYSGLFPHLKRHYYDPLGLAVSASTDAFSGLVVCVSMLALEQLRHYLP